MNLKSLSFLYIYKYAYLVIYLLMYSVDDNRLEPMLKQWFKPIANLYDLTELYDVYISVMS